MSAFKWFALAANVCQALHTEPHCPRNVASVPVRLVNRHHVFLSTRFLAFAVFAIYLFPLSSGFGQEPLRVKFRVVSDMIVVPVMINGAGPFNFLLDTGSTVTIVDRKFAEKLHLPPAVKKITLATPQGEVVTNCAHTDSLSMGGATVRGLDLCVVNHYADRLPKVNGLLGEDFLRYFDLLLDNQHQLILFEVGPGQLGNMFTGEHLPLSLNGFSEGKLMRNRLVVVGLIYKVGDQNVHLQIDSGTTSVVLFSARNHPLGRSDPYSIQGAFGSSLADTITVQFLQLGNKTFHDLLVVAPKGNIPMDVDGLLPTTLFRSIFISHSGKFIILDPKQTPAQSKPLPRPNTEISDTDQGLQNCESRDN